MRAILGNPRYTGFEVWNKQRKDEVLVDVEDVALGHVTKQRWNDKDDWIWSAEPTHEAIVSRDLFDTVQSLFGTKRGPTTRTPIKGRRYVLSGLLHCNLCGRRMQGQWTHGQAYYRCKFTDEYPGGDEQHPKNVYVREAAITPGLDAWLGSLFDDEHLDDACAALAGASEPDPEAEKRDADLRTRSPTATAVSATTRSSSTTRTPSPSPPAGSPRSSASARTSSASSGGTCRAAS